MITSRVYPGVLFLALLIGCSTVDDDLVIEEREGVEYVTNLGGLDSTGFPLRFELEQSFGAEDGPLEESIADVSTLAVDAKGNLYVLDRRNSWLMAFDASGTHLWNAGREGTGPGELMGARDMALLDGEIHISNQYGTRLDAWNTSGEHIGTVPLPDEIGQGATFEGYISRTMVFSTGSPKAISSTLWFFDADTHAFVDSITFRQDFEQEIPGQISQMMVADASGYRVMVASSTEDYTVWIVTPDGKLERQVRLGVDHLWAPTVIENMFVPSVGIRKMISLSDGGMLVYVMVQKTDPAESARRRMAGEASSPTGRLTTLDHFDSTGRYLGSMTKHDGNLDIGTPHSVGPDGRLYTTVRTPYPAVRRYRIVRE